MELSRDSEGAFELAAAPVRRAVPTGHAPPVVNAVSASPIKVLVLTRYSRLGASSRLRFHKLIEAFGPSAQSGLSFTISPLLGDEYLDRLYGGNNRDAWYLVRQYLKRAAALFQLGRYDVVWIEKEVFPGLPAVAERLMRLFGIKTVVDFDDATFLFYEKHSNPIVRLLMRRKIDAVFSAATTVTAGNRFLAARALRGGASDVVIVPTVVDTSSYSLVAPRRRQPGERPVIGWIGTPSNAKYLHLYRDALVRAQHLHGARFMTIGAPENCLPGVVQEAVLWSEATEIQLLSSWDVALAPLESGPWELGKCAYKVLQCMAAGLPVIASPVGVIPDIVHDGKNGFLAQDAATCSEVLDMLIGDPERSFAVGSAARETVEHDYSINQLRSLLHRTLVGAAGDASKLAGSHKVRDVALGGAINSERNAAPSWTESEKPARVAKAARAR